MAEQAVLYLWKPHLDCVHVHGSRLGTVVAAAVHRLIVGLMSTMHAVVADGASHAVVLSYAISAESHQAGKKGQATHWTDAVQVVCHNEELLQAGPAAGNWDADDHAMVAMARDSLERQQLAYEQHSHRPPKADAWPVTCPQ